MPEQTSHELQPRRSGRVRSSSSLGPTSPSPLPPPPLPQSPSTSHPNRRVSSITTIQSLQAGNQEVAFSRIESILKSIREKTMEGQGPLFLPYRSRKASAMPQDSDNQRVWPGENECVEGVRFPGKTVTEGRQFGERLLFSV
jgi:hypothetical protein